LENFPTPGYCRIFSLFNIRGFSSSWILEGIWVFLFLDIRGYLGFPPPGCCTVGFSNCWIPEDIPNSQYCRIFLLLDSGGFLTPEYCNIIYRRIFLLVDTEGFLYCWIVEDFLLLDIVVYLYCWIPKEFPSSRYCRIFTLLDTGRVFLLLDSAGYSWFFILLDTGGFSHFWML